MQTANHTAPPLTTVPPVAIAAASIGTFVARRSYISVPEECPIDTVLTIMSQSGKRVAAVVDDHRTLHGFLTRSGIFGGLVYDPGRDQTLDSQTSTVRGLTAGNLMIRHPAFLASELATADALSIMTEYGYQYMPVLENGARLMGIADLRDLVQHEQDSNRQLVEEKDNLLSWLMHHESYALCGPVAANPPSRGAL